MVNVMSHLVLMQEAVPIFNSNADGGVFLITSSAAVRNFFLLPPVNSCADQH
jgi:hypothetical protein